MQIMDPSCLAKLNALLTLKRSIHCKVKGLSILKTNNEDRMSGRSVMSTVRDPEDGEGNADDVVSSKAAYASWMKEHPSALLSFDRIMKAAKGKRIVVFLDYDGTLSPIVNDPDCAFMSDEMRGAVREVAKYFPTTIISGRSRDKVKEFVNLTNIYYAGSHGMDILAPLRPVKSRENRTLEESSSNNGDEVIFQPAKKFLPTIQKIFQELEGEISKIKGARLEDNRFCISVHFRQVDAKDYGMLEEKVKSVLQNYEDFRLTRGRKVMEIRPSIEWNKGHALEYFLDSLGFSNSNDVLPLYIGDDRTDEDAFKVIEKMGRGYPIIVSSVPKETKASYSLKDPSEVLGFLLRLSRWRKASSLSRSSNQIWGLGD